MDQILTPLFKCECTLLKYVCAAIFFCAIQFMFLYIYVISAELVVCISSFFFNFGIKSCIWFAEPYYITLVEKAQHAPSQNHFKRRLLA